MGYRPWPRGCPQLLDSSLIRFRHCVPRSLERQSCPVEFYAIFFDKARRQFPVTLSFSTFLFPGCIANIIRSIYSQSVDVSLQTRECICFRGNAESDKDEACKLLASRLLSLEPWGWATPCPCAIFHSRRTLPPQYTIHISPSRLFSSEKVSPLRCRLLLRAFLDRSFNPSTQLGLA